jgi:hypothetical protein
MLECPPFEKFARIAETFWDTVFNGGRRASMTSEVMEKRIVMERSDAVVVRCFS